MSWARMSLLAAIAALLALLATFEPVLPDAEDCAEMNRPADCWRDFERAAVRPGTMP